MNLILSHSRIHSTIEKKYAILSFEDNTFLLCYSFCAMILKAYVNRGVGGREVGLDNQMDSAHT